MSMETRELASGPGWYVLDYCCTAGPQDRAFEERHDTAALSLVLSGTFQYRTAAGQATLVPGSILLGNEGACFECGHEHGTGDRCLSIHFSPSYWEEILAATPGMTAARFPLPALPPSGALLPHTALLTAAREKSGAALEEEVLRFAGAALSAAHATPPPARTPSGRDVRRVSEAVRFIEGVAHDLEADLSLSNLSALAVMSPYHFLRIFRHVTGMTPHQFILLRRMSRAAVRLRTEDAPIASIAFEAGFNDLSTFNRRFRKLVGKNPRDYRRA